MKPSANTVLILVFITALASMNATCRAQAQDKQAPWGAAAFPEGRSFVELPFQLERDRAIILVKVNDSGFIKFLVDTGSQTPNLRGAAQAESLNLKIIGVARVGGAGSGPAARAKVAGDVLFNLSGATLKVAEMIVPPPPETGLPPLSSFGVIGRPLFENFVVEFDWTRRFIKLYDPAKYIYSGKGLALPLTFDESGSPYVTCTVSITDGTLIPVKLLVDTGANFALGLDVGSHPDIKLPERSVAAIVGVGAQGKVTGHMGRAKSLRLGSYEFKHVFVDFAAESNPFVGTAESQGLIGTDILRRFKVIFDYSRKRMILEPNQFFNEPFDGYTTGFTYTRTHLGLKELKLTAIFEGSAGREAGLLVGDEILKINGQALSVFTDDELYRMFRKRDAPLVLEIKRGSRQFKVKMKLRRFI